MAHGVKIERRRLGEQVTELVRRMIHLGDLPPGQRLVEEHLAERLGTSRTPIREALHRLEQENLVVRRNTGGYEVRPLTAREVEEVIGVRAALESYAVELGCRRMTPERLERLERNVAGFAKALQERDYKRLVALNTAFHEMVYQMADSTLLTRLISELADVLHRFRVSLLSDVEAASRSLLDHQRMLQALREGDTNQAARFCREHILAGGIWILANMDNQARGSEPNGS